MPIKKENTTEEKEKKVTPTRYLETVGRRKTSTCRVRIIQATKKSFVVNKKSAEDYFKTDELLKIINSPLEKEKIGTKFNISVMVKGGGIHSQAEAVRHGLSRGLVLFDEKLRSDMKKAGFLKRDPRMKERRKFGLKKARKAPQWSKR